MSISKGGQSVKPYVGSKEVKEAYVGSQLVYRAVPPVVYGFLGSENDYVIAPWCQLGNDTTIIKNDNIYRISMSIKSPSYGKITISEIHGTKFKFTAKLDNNTANLIIVFVVNGKETSQNIGSLTTSNYTLKSYDVPAGTTEIRLQCSSPYNMKAGYFDAIRFENE